jgi:hypothetical protein
MARTVLEGLPAEEIAEHQVCEQESREIAELAHFQVAKETQALGALIEQSRQPRFRQPRQGGQ